MAKPSNYVGKSLTIKKGAYVTRNGKLISIRRSPSTVTVLKQESATNGKTRIFWKSQGRQVSTLI